MKFLDKVYELPKLKRLLIYLACKWKPLYKIWLYTFYLYLLVIIFETCFIYLLFTGHASDVKSPRKLFISPTKVSNYRRFNNVVTPSNYNVVSTLQQRRRTSHSQPKNNVSVTSHGNDETALLQRCCACWVVMKCKNKTASCNDETCPFDEMFGLKEDPPSQE